MFGQKEVTKRMTQSWDGVDVQRHPGGNVTEYFYNDLEAYARYLELKLQFYDYQKLSDERKAEIKQEADNSGSVAFDEQTGMTYVDLPECRFGCGGRPCSCDSAYRLYQELHKRFNYKEPLPNNCVGVVWVDLDRILRGFDKDKHYKKFNAKQAGKRA